MDMDIEECLPELGFQFIWTIKVRMLSQNWILAWAIKGSPFWNWISVWAIKVRDAFLELDFSLNYERNALLDLNFGLNYEGYANSDLEFSLIRDATDFGLDLNYFEVENNYEAFEGQDEIINYMENVEFTPCVVIDFVEGKIQRCEEKTKLRQLRNLFGIWQINREAIKEVDGILLRLGVCDSHFQFDNKYLHKSQNKQLKEFNQGIIQWCRCISCNKYITYFSQGVGCTIHSWKLNNKNIQVPCIGQYSCEALRALPLVCKRAFDNIK
ncbi:hypothetical protein RclHR1_25310002 [Rhizophagus clarus]|uniref:Uncharacterized protein n=1 Tax=Rhizophagus clarus TaxID=94130 RepID=A0A2Z6QZL2_9GLOM|nr:hypothetical protein RclHR1_25310002 [Rhizophagus clarus]